MRQFHVQVFFAHCKGSDFVENWDSVITFVRAYLVNGVYVSEDWAELIFQPFGQLHLHPPRDGRHPALTEPYQEFLDSLTEEEWLEGTTDDVIVLPVSRFEFIEGVWFEHQQRTEPASA